MGDRGGREESVSRYPCMWNGFHRLPGKQNNSAAFSFQHYIKEALKAASLRRVREASARSPVSKRLLSTGVVVWLRYGGDTLFCMARRLHERSPLVVR